MSQRNSHILGAFVVLCGLLSSTQTVFAATTIKKTTAVAPKVAVTKMEVGGWIPYWRTATGTADVLPHLSGLTVIHPFVFTLKQDGTLNDAGKLTEEPWASFIAEAKKKKVRVIPTIMSGNGDAIHALLSDTTSRVALEDAIAAMVKQNKFDGVDIDFEAKKAETNKYFSTFLKGLYQRLGNKYLYCTIESRTPLDSRYDSTPPSDATVYANDYVALNKYCDRVTVMAYDQGSIDLKLNKARAAPYVPVADPAWVEKVMTLAAKTISKKKLLLGIPTYGYEYQVKPLSEYGYRYDLMWAFNPKYAVSLAQQLNIQPVRNSAGELSFIYKPVSGNSTTPDSIVSSTAGNVVALPSSVYSQAAIAGSLQPPFNIVWWSDAQAIKDKVAVAKKLGIRGVEIFKFDGGEDQAMWDVLPTPTR